MSDEPNLPDLMKIPLNDDGEPNFQAIAAGILQGLDTCPANFRLNVPWKSGDQEGWFQGRCEPDGTLAIRESCLGTKFGAGLFLALQALDPEHVKAKP
jgi:hypothetical protein